MEKIKLSDYLRHEIVTVCGFSDYVCDDHDWDAIVTEILEKSELDIDVEIEWDYQQNKITKSGN